ncbi:GCN5-related N-acetyltransferase protein [Rhizobium etli 8C-3]|uniref:Phosphinothricin acetyltransferase n=2 Tax=Rhizobium TaxID=379 RepID=A0A4R3QP29_9HYPH|nr:MULTISPECIES: GNAT family N-acetyltransferase [Rhizobium]APO76678.1 GCN5-related N-acetyltransferase protein [Rhizobium etli 8C-3]TCU23923.1 phosphinothricin acetyltransferase [Rhizobium azibense]TCU36191.1 phosphinothricin acetyltransferase [Rhizobium azibense]
MPFLLRDATLSDLPAIAEIYRDSVLNGVASYEIIPPSEAEMTTRFCANTSSGYPYIAAVDQNGALLGYAYASAFRTRPAYRWMVEDSIYLAPAARGLGIGRALLTALISRCTQLGFRQMVAVIGGAHPASIALHRALGFEETGLLKGSGYKHGRWLDTMIMQRPLGDGKDSDPDPSVYPGTLFEV